MVIRPPCSTRVDGWGSMRTLEPPLSSVMDRGPIRSARDVSAAEAYAQLDAARMPHYKSPVRCGRAIAAVSWYAEAKRRLQEAEV